MKRLIVNADDFGITEGVCAGIIEAIERGIVTQTSAMMCGDGTAERVRTWAPRIQECVGVHLQITDGVPCLPVSEVPSLVNEQGRFPRNRAGLRQPEPAEVEAEWLAQVGRARELGLDPQHFDTHHHAHMSFTLWPVFAAVAEASGAGVRSGPPILARALRDRNILCADLCATEFYGDDLDEDRFIRVVDQAFGTIGGEGLVEMMTHPGHSSEELAARSLYSWQRENELKILTSPSLRRRIEDAGIELVAMSSLVRERVTG